MKKSHACCMYKVLMVEEIKAYYYGEGPKNYAHPNSYMEAVYYKRVNFTSMFSIKQSNSKRFKVSHFFQR